ncbi:hypothetical protein HU200_005897 [Digitaria exilis]|uniref:NB-ARC domain-containing protein n=1 Tax=Digitaria exilis TaxID=1010633 RepID=A0A835FQZ3_9POAL|nr:hypothetical protein HU200_005897 [Digitaria exilis]
MVPALPLGEEDTERAPAGSEQQQQETQERVQVAPSPSKAEQGKEDAEMSVEEQDEEGAEIAPAASEQQQQETEERVQQIAPAASEEKEKEREREKKVAKMVEAMRLLEPLPAKITELLESAGYRRVRDRSEHPALELMKMELTDIVDSLKLMLPALKDSRVGVELELEFHWLNGLIPFARDVHSLVRQVADSRLYTLVRRAVRFFRPSNKVVLYSMMEESFRAAEYANKFRCLFLASGSSGQALPPCPGLPLFGIDRPTKKLLRWLMPSEGTEKRLRLMAILGPDGIGKTTLAMEVQRRLQQCQGSGGHYSFHCNVVARVSNSSHRKELLLRDILSQISELTVPVLTSDQSSSKATMELLVHHVREYLQAKRYFILIDDLWHGGDWEEIKDAFPNNDLDSRLFITTRVQSIAWSCRSDSDDVLVHEMKPLNWMDSQRLLLVKAFGSVEGSSSSYSMKLLCDKILMRCEGIPLFITAMADWLKEKYQQQQHEEKEEQKHAFASGEQVPQIPECLREYSVIDNRMKEAKLYFSQLVDRNFISSGAANCKPGSNEAETRQWHVNQVLLQILASKSAKLGFAFTSSTLVETATGHGSVSTRMPRRLALYHPDPLLPSVIQTLDLSRTRWLTVSGAVSGIPLNKFIYLVVLDLEGWVNLNNEDLEHICTCKMFVLEYLSIAHTRVSKLPDEIKKLQNLMVLDVRRTKISALPFGVSELKRLYHLDIRGTAIRGLGKEIVGLQSTLRTLLIGAEGMIHSTQAAPWVPHDVLQHFQGLHTLATIDLTRQSESFIMALGDLGNLKVLGVTWSFHQCTHRAYRKALQLSITKMELRLKSLTIHCGIGCSMEFLGDIFLGEPWVLEKFKVTAGRFAHVPRWINKKLEFLSFVQITICGPITDDLERLGELLHLRCLILGLDFIPQEAITIGNVGFPDLQRFSVDCQMPWLTFKAGAMRKLRYLQLKLCTCPVTSQTSVPSGIGCLGSLSEVALCYNARYTTSRNVKVTVEAVTKQVAAHPNQIDLFINDYQDYSVQAADEETENNAIRTQRQSDAEIKTWCSSGT